MLRGQREREGERGGGRAPGAPRRARPVRVCAPERRRQRLAEGRDHLLELAGVDEALPRQYARKRPVAFSSSACPSPVSACHPSCRAGRRARARARRRARARPCRPCRPCRLAPFGHRVARRGRARDAGRYRCKDGFPGVGSGPYPNPGWVCAANLLRVSPARDGTLALGACLSSRASGRATPGPPARRARRRRRAADGATIARTRCAWRAACAPRRLGRRVAELRYAAPPVARAGARPGRPRARGRPTGRRRDGRARVRAAVARSSTMRATSRARRTACACA